MSLADKIISIAESQLGTCEQPLGSNYGPAIRKYKAETWLDPDAAWPWCNAFTDWVWKQATGKTICRHAAVNGTWEWAKTNGYARDLPRRGDAVCLDYNGDGDLDHISFVEKVEGDVLYCIGGNQSNCVTRTTYRRSQAVGFIRLEEDPKPVPSKRPKYEIVVNIRGDKRVVYTVGSVEAVLKKAKQTLKKYKTVIIRRK